MSRWCSNQLSYAPKSVAFYPFKLGGSIPVPLAAPAGLAIERAAQYISLPRTVCPAMGLTDLEKACLPT